MHKLCEKLAIDLYQYISFLKLAVTRALLSRVNWLAHERGFHLVNADATITLERPKLREHIEAMRENLARTLDADIGCVSVKAKTGEGLDAVGRGYYGFRPDLDPNGFLVDAGVDKVRTVIPKPSKKRMLTAGRAAVRPTVSVPRRPLALKSGGPPGCAASQVANESAAGSGTPCR